MQDLRHRPHEQRISAKGLQLKAQGCQDRLQTRDSVGLAATEVHAKSLCQFQAARLCTHELLIQHTLMRGVLVEHKQALWSTGDNESIAHLSERAQGGHIGLYRTRIVRHRRFADAQGWHWHGCPRVCKRLWRDS